VVSVRFRPTALGARAATVHVVTANGGGPLDVAVTGIGVPAPASGFAANPATLDFGARGVLRVSPVQTVTVSNPGTAPLAVKAVRLGAAGTGSFPGDYQIVGTGCANSSVPPAGTCVIGVRHAPKAVGVRPATLLIDYVGTATLTHTVRLLGTGTPPTFTVSPTVSPATRVVQVTGANFPPGVRVEMTLFGMPGVTKAKVDANGVLHTPLVIMPITWTGKHALTVTVAPASAPTIVGPLAVAMDYLIVPGSPVPPDFVARH
jgi:hypothetical protein